MSIVAEDETEEEAWHDDVPEAEHAFTDMMGFYVPMQAASGATEFPATSGGGQLINPTEYYHIDDALVETLLVAAAVLDHLFAATVCVVASIVCTKRQSSPGRIAASAKTGRPCASKWLPYSSVRPAGRPCAS